MRGIQYPTEFPGEVRRLIRQAANRLSESAGFTRSDNDDVQQKLIVHLWRNWSKATNEGTIQIPYVRRVIKNKVVSIVRARKAECRDYRREAFSLGNTMKDGDGRGAAGDQIIDANEGARRLGRRPLASADKADLAQDLMTAVARLPAGKQELFLQLLESSPTQVSEETGVSRGTLYDIRNVVRRFLIAEGWEDRP